MIYPQKFGRDFSFVAHGSVVAQTSRTMIFHDISSILSADVRLDEGMLSLIEREIECGDVEVLCREQAVER
jgi:hypothetical protein